MSRTQDPGDSVAGSGDRTSAITIAARQDLAQVRVLAASFALHHPTGQFFALVIDAEPAEFASDSTIRFLTPSDLPLNDDEFRQMAMFYDKHELAAAMKPSALQAVLRLGAKTVVYISADSFVYAPLIGLTELTARHGIVLTPHRLAPVPRDELRPTDEELLRAGVFNLGFVAVGPDAAPMLDWWRTRLREDSLMRPLETLFADQRWMDLVPGLFEHMVLRDPGYNVAYWNVDHRTINRVGGQLVVGGSPLRTFHFSGFDPNQPWALSKHVADRPRVTLDEHPVLDALCADYAEQLVEQTKRRTQPYRWDTLNDGTPITDHMRAMYRRAVLSVDLRSDSALPIPFKDDDHRIVAWFREPVRPSGRINRWLRDVWSSRADLQAAFPDPLGADEDDMVRWAWSHTGDDPFVVAWLLPDVDVADPGSTSSTGEPGVNLAGYLSAEMGVGELSRLTAAALQCAQLPYATFVNRDTLSRQQARYTSVDSGVRYPVTVAAVNADQFPAWAAGGGRELRRNRHVIGLWAWETEDFPDYPASLELVDEIWAISHFVADAIRTRTDKPVHVIPLPVLEPADHEELDRMSLGLPDGPYFLFVFDYLSVLERKNPAGLIEAFRRAFPQGDGPRLVIKTINGERFRSDRARLGMAVHQNDRGTRDIIVLDRYLDRETLSSLMSEATAYVSLHRSEGFGLTMAEAMARGVPVIATDYSGNRDFMTSNNSLLVPYTRVAIGGDAAPYPPDSCWAAPDLRVAADLLRWVADHPSEASALGAAGRSSIRTTHGLATAARFISQRVDSIVTARALLSAPPELAMNAAPPAGPAFRG